MKTDWTYAVVWEFQVRQGLEAGFEQSYGPDGDWVRLFGSDPEYCGTELIRDAGMAGRYLTLDYWASEAAYEVFRTAHAAEYNEIDQRCEGMTTAEREVGRFSRM